MKLEQLEKLYNDPSLEIEENGFTISLCAYEERYNSVINGKNAHTLKVILGFNILGNEIDEFVEDYYFDKDRKDRDRTLKEVNDIIEKKQ